MRILLITSHANRPYLVRETGCSRGVGYAYAVPGSHASYGAGSGGGLGKSRRTTIRARVSRTAGALGQGYR